MTANRLMQLSAEQRVKLACDMFDMHKALAIASMPEHRGADLQVALFRRLYGMILMNEPDQPFVHIYVVIIRASTKGPQ
jgi:hypothetical protein